jgi:hypothetical protein
MFKKSPLKRTQLHRKKRRMRLLKIGGVVFVLLILFAGVVWMSHWNSLILSDVEVKGNAAVDSQDIQDIAQKHFQGKYYFLFPRSNKFFYQKDAIVEDILATHPRIKSAHLKVNRQTLEISIEERVPSYTWCKGQPQVEKGDCYFIDDNGFIFSNAPSFSGNVYVAFYGLVVGNTPIGATYLNKDTFSTIGSVIEFFNTKNIPTYALLASPNGVMELYFSQGGKLVFKNDQASSTLINNIDLILKDTHILSPSMLPTLEYLDIRFGNKVYYKIKGDNQLQIQEDPEV